ncbi:hypothetical protein pb186bvf_016459 [Paramecium bursaria]
MKTFVFILILITAQANRIETCVQECNAKQRGCMYGCASSQITYNLKNQEKCRLLCEGLVTDCKTNKCFVISA